LRLIASPSKLPKAPWFLDLGCEFEAPVARRSQNEACAGSGSSQSSSSSIGVASLAMENSCAIPDSQQAPFTVSEPTLLRRRNRGPWKTCAIGERTTQHCSERIVHPGSIAAPLPLTGTEQHIREGSLLKHRRRQLKIEPASGMNLNGSRREGSPAEAAAEATVSAPSAASAAVAAAVPAAPSAVEHQLASGLSSQVGDLPDVGRALAAIFGASSLRLPPAAGTRAAGLAPEEHSHPGAAAAMVCGGSADLLAALPCDVLLGVLAHAGLRELGACMALARSWGNSRSSQGRLLVVSPIAERECMVAAW